MSDKEEVGNWQPKKDRGVIDYIIGGFSRGGETNWARKRHLQAIMNVESNPLRSPKTPNPVISFSDLDL